MILVEQYLDKVCGKNYLDDELFSNKSCGLKKILGEFVVCVCREGGVEACHITVLFVVQTLPKKKMQQFPILFLNTQKREGRGSFHRMFFFFELLNWNNTGKHITTAKKKNLHFTALAFLCLWMKTQVFGACSSPNKHISNFQFDTSCVRNTFHNSTVPFFIYSFLTIILFSNLSLNAVTFVP